MKDGMKEGLLAGLALAAIVIGTVAVIVIGADLMGIRLQ